MAFVEVICKNCGGKIILDDKMKSGVCEYCKTTFVREDTNITNHFHNNTTVVYNTDSSIEEKLKSADVHLNKLNNYSEAEEIYEYVTQNKADDYRGWWGMALVLSRKLTYIECGDYEFNRIKKYAESALRVADEEQKKEIYPLWSDYKNKVDERMEEKHHQEKEKEKKLAIESKQMEKKETIRKNIGIALSLVCNIGMLIWCFLSTNMQELNENPIISLLIFCSVLFGNSVLTTIFCKICSAENFLIVPVIANAVAIITIIARDMWGAEFGFMFIIGLIGWVILGAIILVVSSLIPFILFLILKDY